jgi:hypothetical protein
VCFLHLPCDPYWNANNVLEYLKIIRAVGVGFIMMGVVGYAIKLVCFKCSMEPLLYTNDISDPHPNPLLDCLIITMRYLGEKR